jgi:hypothetical protein
VRQPEEYKWTIAGVSPNARKVAREAAKREHMKLGAWLERAIRQASPSDIPRVDIRQPEDPRPHRRYF